MNEIMWSLRFIGVKPVIPETYFWFKLGRHLMKIKANHTLMSVEKAALVIERGAFSLNNGPLSCPGQCCGCHRCGEESET